MVAPKILVVDDDKNLLELAKTRLAAANYGVTVALGQEEALEAVNNESFDLAIVDLRLADEDGITLMEKLHALFPGMPVIILTGHASVEGAVDAMKRGAYTYLTKPFDPRELILQIAKLRLQILLEAIHDGIARGRIAELRPQRNKLGH